MAQTLFNLTKSFSNSIIEYSRKHQNKLIGVGVVGSLLWTSKFIFSCSLKNMETQMLLQEEALEAMKTHSYFQTAQSSCNSSIISFIPTLKEKLLNLIEILNSSDLRSTHNQSKGIQDKLHGWETFKIQTFSRISSTIYSTCLITLFLRVQVNILGRYLYLENINCNSETTQKQKENLIEPSIQKQYFVLADFFLQSGILKMKELIETVVKDQLVQMSLTKKYNFGDIMNMFDFIRSKIESSHLFAPSLWLLPTEIQFKAEYENSNDFTLLCLVDETRDVLESPIFQNYLQITLFHGFRLMGEQIQLGISALSTPDQDLLPLPKLLPLIKKQFQTILEPQNDDYKFLQALFSIQELQDFSLQVFQKVYDE